MATSSKESDKTTRREVLIANCLNELNSVNLLNTSENDNWKDLITDYFLDDSSMEEYSDNESDTESEIVQPTTTDSAVFDADSNNDDIDEEHAIIEEIDLGLLETDSEEVVGLKRKSNLPKVRNIDPSIITLCKCKHNNGQPCHSRYTEEYLKELRCSLLELSKEEKDIAILAKISCSIHSSPTTMKTKKAEQSPRLATRSTYYHGGQLICRDMFCYINCIARQTLTVLQKHYAECDLVPRQHKNTKRLPPHSISFDDRQAIVSFILNYAEAHAISLPGRIPGYFRDDIKLLPTDCSKKKLYDEYLVACQICNRAIISYTTFRRTWQRLTPFIVNMKPATDLCWICQKNTNKIFSNANKSESEKSESLKFAEAHLLRAKHEREYYKKVCSLSKCNETENVRLNRNHACSLETTHPVHYSMDFAQQVHFPNHPLQPGPMFFKTPRKCAVFGIHCETVSQQVNFLIDEGSLVGKGSNTVISLLHYFFSTYGLGENEVCLHADNCAGQNKNNFVLWYLLWRCLTGRHAKITYCFLPVGHTKFSVDWAFGLFKKKFRSRDINCLSDISESVRLSSNSGLNIPHMVCADNGSPSDVPTYDWVSFLGQFFRKFEGIKKYHFFQFANDDTKMTVKLFSDTPEIQYDLKKRNCTLPDKDDFPNVIIPPGLTPERQWYLYDEIREYVSDNKRDEVCPLPTVPKP